MQRAGGPRQAKSRRNNRLRPRARRQRGNRVQIGVGERARRVGRVERPVRIRRGPDGGRELALYHRPLGDAVAVGIALQVHRNRAKLGLPVRTRRAGGARRRRLRVASAPEVALAPRPRDEAEVVRLVLWAERHGQLVVLLRQRLRRLSLLCLPQNT